jgi:diguanylate cyclase (GGDEF)-like protein
MGEQMNNVSVPSAESDIAKKRSRVDKSRATDNPLEDSVYDLAKVEDKFREKLIELGMDKKAINGVADEISDETLEKIEANKARYIDDSTRLRSKNAYIIEMPQLLSMERRAEKACSMLMIDLDHFKKVNDVYGHLVGDEVLRMVADLIKNSLRSSDIVYRYGGEEFVVFLPDTLASVAQNIAEQIRANVEAQALKITDANGEKVILHKTVSVGVVDVYDIKGWEQYRANEGDAFLKKMLDSADIAVYDSKKNGRNRVTHYDKTLEEI